MAQLPARSQRQAQRGRGGQAMSPEPGELVGPGEVSVVYLWEDFEPDKWGRVTLSTENRIATGSWLILVEQVDCPNPGCHGGEVWNGDLCVCPVCGGMAWVDVGRGGGAVHRSWSAPHPDGPAEEPFHYVELSYLILTGSEDGRFTRNQPPAEARGLIARRPSKADARLAYFRPSSHSLMASGAHSRWPLPVWANGAGKSARLVHMPTL